MKILLIEDDDFKSADVMAYLHASGFEDVKLATSYKTGVRMAKESDYDFMIVDMTLPKYTDERGAGKGSMPTGGEILINAFLDMDIYVKCVVLTQYDSFEGENMTIIDQRLKASCSDIYMGYIKYSTSEESWKNKLLNCIHDAVNINH